MTDRTRCGWATNDLMARYHDEEWGVPLHDGRKLFEFMVLDGAQAGLSWNTILQKRENYRAAFDGFAPARVARYDRRKVRQLLANPGIVRNRLKIESAITNARAFLAVEEEFNGFDAYIWQFTGGRTIVNRWRSLEDVPARSRESDTMSGELKSRGFTFVGSTICYAFMQAAGMVNDHLVQCFRHAEVCSLVFDPPRPCGPARLDRIHAPKDAARGSAAKASEASTRKHQQGAS